MKTTMPFGKYKGCHLADIPESYLVWVLENVDRLTPNLRQSIVHHLAMSVKQTPPPSIDICERWYRKLSMEFHPDVGGSHEAMKAVNRGGELLKELAGESKR